MRYEITHIWAGPDNRVVKKRKDAASSAFRLMVREAIAGYAGLDTAWGWNAYRTAVRIAADIERGVDLPFAASVTLPAHCGNETITIRVFA